MEEYSIVLKDVSKSYKEGFCLKDISINLSKGEIMGLVGENGAGKTTIIKLILNLILRDKGEIKVFGLDNIKNENKVKENIGVVFDQCCFDGSINAKNVDKIMSGIYKQWSSSVFFKYLSDFDIPTELLIKKYSKGMKMKISIAAALSHDAKLLIMDEAMGGLDPIARDHMLDVFRDYIRDDRAMIISSHITSDLEKICDYISLIHNGELIFSKGKDEIDEYGILKCGLEQAENVDREDMLGKRDNRFGSEILVANKYDMKTKYPEFIIDNANLEDIMFFCIRGGEER